jgi:DNA replication protein DnaC
MIPTLIETLQQDLRALRLKDMAEALETVLAQAERNQHGHIEFLATLVDKQRLAAHTRSLDRRIRMAGFPRNMTFDNFDWGFQPALNVEYLKNLKTLTFVAKHQPLLILGKTGTGKTHIATALGITACQAGFRVKFFKLQELMAQLYATLADDTTAETIARLTRLDLLIIDHIGFIRAKPEYPSLLLDLVCACQDHVALIITSSISLEEWGQAFGNHTITHDIVDRLFHRAGVINIRPGKSYRTQGPQAPQLPQTQNQNPTP